MPRIGEMAEKSVVASVLEKRTSPRLPHLLLEKAQSFVFHGEKKARLFDETGEKFIVSSVSSSRDKKDECKLLVLCQLFYPELVSTGQTLTELCEELVKLGISVKVVCGQPTLLPGRKKVARHITHKGIHIRRVWGTSFPKLNLIGRIVNQITFAISAFFYQLFASRRRPVLVLTNPPFLALSCAILKMLRLGGPYIYLVFDVYPDTAVNVGVLEKEGFVCRVWERANKLMMNHASAIIVIGRCMEDVIYRKMSSLGLNRGDKIHRIHVWCDDKAIGGGAEKKVSPFVKAWGLEGKFVVGYFGNMGRFHDIETIMEATKALCAYDQIVFLFAGEGHKKAWAVEYAGKKGLSNCQFHGYVERDELGSLLSTADVGLVSLLEGQEGLSVPSKTFALMAASVPVMAIMSQTSEVARIIEEVRCGVIIRPGDSLGLTESILDIYNDRRKSRDMGANGKEAIEKKYSLGHAAEAYRRLIYTL